MDVEVYMNMFGQVLAQMEVNVLPGEVVRMDRLVSDSTLGP